MSNPGIPYLTPPATLVNEALDRIGRSEKAIGDISDGTPIAEVARRNYGQLLRQLLRTSHWKFCRKQAPLILLADASGNTPNVSTFVDQPWLFCYAWPIDAVAARWLPYGIPTNTTNPIPPTGVPLQAPLIPAPFLVSSSDQYPIESGSLPWADMPDLRRTFGVGPTNRTIILTNACNALLVYTRFAPVIEEWDADFREAFVACLALTLIPVAIEDPKERLTQRNAMIAIAKNTIVDAQVANGRDSGYPQTTDHQPVWISARNSGWGAQWGGWGQGGLGAGGTYFPWDSSFSWAGCGIYP
jgi:hypothetical protein